MSRARDLGEEYSRTGLLAWMAITGSLGKETHSDPSPDDIFETVKVILEFGADRNLGKPITARECGLVHPQERIRALFSDSTWSSLQGDFTHKPDFLQIGRTWMLSSSSGLNETEHEGSGLTDDVNAESLSDGYHSISAPDEDQEQSDHLDLSSFPVLNADGSSISSLKTHVLDGPWSPSNVDSLTASFSIIPKTHTSPAAELRDDPFPRLNSCISKNPFETEAGQIWAKFGKSKSHPAAEEPFPTSANSKVKSSPSEVKRGKTGKKIRWQPLEV